MAQGGYDFSIAATDEQRREEEEAQERMQSRATGAASSVASIINHINDAAETGAVDVRVRLARMRCLLFLLDRCFRVLFTASSSLSSEDSMQASASWAKYE